MVILNAILYLSIVRDESSNWRRGAVEDNCKQNVYIISRYSKWIGLDWIELNEPRNERRPENIINTIQIKLFIKPFQSLTYFASLFIIHGITFLGSASSLLAYHQLLSMKHFDSYDRMAQFWCGMMYSFGICFVGHI